MPESVEPQFHQLGRRDITHDNRDDRGHHHGRQRHEAEHLDEWQIGNDRIAARSRARLRRESNNDRVQASAHRIVAQLNGSATLRPGTRLISFS
jgi:hypothetical protein